jgi:surface polysaccharide O-acyltransferase-like enzyme
MRLHINGGYVQRHSNLLATILMLAAIVFVMGSGILYLGERVHAPEQTRMIVTGPPDPPLRIE